MVMDNVAMRPGGDPYAQLPGELLGTARAVASTYAPAAPSEEFRGALRARLVREASRLQSEPAGAPRSGLLVPAAVGAAAVAGLAVIAWRTRAIAGIVSHAQDQLRAAHSGS